MPSDVSLPLFAYGVFRRGQLGFLLVRHAVQRVDEASVEGELRERDGLALLDEGAVGHVAGELLTFATTASPRAYERIASIEPEHQYVWTEKDVSTATGMQRANVLAGRSPRKGSAVLDRDWDGRRDPLFTDALDVVKDTVDAWRGHGGPEDMRSFFGIQMAYLLLWSCIERYTAFRYGLGAEVWQRVKRLATEAAFQQGLRTYAPGGAPDDLYRVHRPKERVRLDPDDPAGSVDYLYQMRSNIAHRGKAVPRDVERVLRAVDVLLPTFKTVLKSAFEEAARA
jgi:hypothetical protein